MTLNAVIPLALYVHLPWCVRKCPYCDFNSHAVKTSIPEEDYIDALIRDLEAELPLVWGRSLESIFIGGGTPSLFSADAINRLLSELRARLNMRPNLEITLEANPGTVEQDHFIGYRQAGINRISLGVQSFSETSLKALGRIHGADESRQAFATARQAGFENINIDLMFGLPAQSREAALEDLQIALSLGSEHLSWYELTLEPNTLFARFPPTDLPDDEELWEMQAAGQQLLAAQGFEQYEVSAYSRAKQQCRHNLNYWEFGDYIGIGSGAHGKISSPATDTVIRRVKPRQPEAYLRAFSGKTSDQEAAEIVSQRTLNHADLSFEFMLNALRLQKPVPKSLFSERTGLPIKVIAKEINQAIERDLLEETPTHWNATPLGRRFLNDLTGLFLKDH
ncbi:coproporphyrinogen III oxidase, anaerobic [Ectothiorhodosinus mongolicus]|uniref:Heme chaperone HemW n=1 Tax=Ectothiorhodosinus mongolicus TaxID=233100 RepID=A0A1R3W0P5_9GAMM|nr:radical SAM family heme chaperone HemW [Ectothiorhodosinus mongolicus]ULX57214.1 YggW family oxidoreductase [Ectothiorhodosinus mongolicus]SIT70455.1 coproporphyrinogen III oxidase, anaerobic [Ectothiorhodosinus mongolicus]